MIRVNQLHYTLLIKHIMNNDATPHELADEIGFHIVSSQRLMRLFHKHKIVHICGWESDRRGRDCTPIYRFGAGKDKAKSKKSPSTRGKEYRARKKIGAIPLSTLQSAHESKPSLHLHQ